MGVPCASCDYETDEGARFCAGCGAPTATACTACGGPVPRDGAFCPTCGAPTATQADQLPPVEERRVVSVLFADLAGFTSRSDGADPEDVHRTLIPFHTLAKEQIERFGGTLDKFIGDAAMGVFGSPEAHEDDPERAVRAALAIQDRADAELDLGVRVAVTTGEAVVTLAQGPQVGENVAGDVVNTASRLQALAPEGGVLVGEATHRLTRDKVDYRELAPATVRGKPLPLQVWVAESVRVEAPGRPDDDGARFVGREHERDLLRDLLDGTVRHRTLHLVTIVGEPGIGKTRLVSDLRSNAPGPEGSVTWLRGRCLPYGGAVTFAPLEEIVRQATGVRRSDGREDAAGKLDRHLRSLAPGIEDVGWLRSRMGPLLGLVDGPDAAAAQRAESFAAWSQFLRAEAALAPTVVVVEDLHWAEPALLDFLDQLGDHADDVPLLLVTTTRPELFDSRRDWGAGVANAATVRLEPLDDDDMRQLLTDLLEDSGLPTGGEDPLVDRVGGNPLYALEFVRMLADAGGVDGALASPDLPGTVQGLIGARLDALPVAQRSLVQDAAVVGDPFWSGALAAMRGGEDPDAVVRELRRRGLVRRTSSQTMAGDVEHVFTHGLIRDVAYARIPRAGRVSRHLAVANWLEDTAGDRVEDRAELLAHHTTAALAFAEAAGTAVDLPALRLRARRFLLLAAQRQTSVDVPLAAAYYRRALELTPPEDPERPAVLRTATESAWRAGEMDVDSAVGAYEEARDEALAQGDQLEAARCLRRLYYQLALRGDTQPAREALDRAVDLLERQGGEPSEVLSELYAARAEDAMFAGRTTASLEWADRALALSHTPGTELMALHIRGNGRCELGDLGGLDDLWDALHRAQAAGSGLDLAQSYSYLAEWVGLQEGPRRSLEMNRAQIEASEMRGLAGQAMWSTVESLWMLYDAGEWNEVLARAGRAVAWAALHEDAQVNTVALTYSARVRVHRGERAAAAALVERFLPAARQIGDLQVLAPALVTAAGAASLGGDGPTAVALLREFDEATADGPSEYRELQLCEPMRICRFLRQADLAEELGRSRPVVVTRSRLSLLTVAALQAEMAGELDAAASRYGEAASGWDRWGDPFERAHALAGRARCLETLGRTEGSADRDAARAIFAGLGVPDAQWAAQGR